MELIQCAILLSALLCSLVAGLVFTFAIVVMPGIRTLGYLDYLKSFKSIDRVIQNNQPIFVLVWAGSVVALLVAAVIGFGQLDATGRLLIVAAALIYVLGVQLPTMIVNVPLNNELQTVDVDTVDDATLKDARNNFEPRWNQWNVIRTVFATLASSLLMLLLYLL